MEMERDLVEGLDVPKEVNDQGGTALNVPQGIENQSASTNGKNALPFKLDTAVSAAQEEQLLVMSNIMSRPDFSWEFDVSQANPDVVRVCNEAVAEGLEVQKEVNNQGGTALNVPKNIENLSASTNGKNALPFMPAVSAVMDQEQLIAKIMSRPDFLWEIDVSQANPDVVRKCNEAVEKMRLLCCGPNPNYQKIDLLSRHQEWMPVHPKKIEETAAPENSKHEGEISIDVVDLSDDETEMVVD